MAETTSKNNVLPSRLPDNYLSDFGAIPGAFAGFMGSVAILAIIGALAVATGQDIWLSPRLIASVLIRGAAETGIIGIALGTIMHLGIGVAYGALFGAITPRMPRALWVVAGLLFGLAIWGLAAFIIPFLIPANDYFNTNTTAYFSALIIANVTFGMFLGVAASIYGIRKA